MGCFSSSNTDGKKNKEPKDKPISQQTLPACKPVLTPAWVVVTFIIASSIMLIFGIICIVYGLKPCEVSQRYDQTCLQNLGSNDARKQYIWKHAGNDSALECTVTLKLECDMPAPVYIWYQIDGMFQNHRRYVKSLSDVQLANLVGNQYLPTCAPHRYLKGNTSQQINPCGLQAWTYFNDSYSLVRTPEGGAPQSLVVSSRGIALESDKKYRVGSQLSQNFNSELDYSRGGGNITGPLNEDERFIVWMRIAALPQFRKLWGKIHTDLKKGDTLSVTIENRYNTYSFDGRKYVVVGTTNWLGSHNPFLGIAFLVTGGMSFMFALLYSVLWITARYSSRSSYNLRTKQLLQTESD